MWFRGVVCCGGVADVGGVGGLVIAWKLFPGAMAGANGGVGGFVVDEVLAAVVLDRCFCSTVHLLSSSGVWCGYWRRG